jgi:hypothetical protein
VEVLDILAVCLLPHSPSLPANIPHCRRKRQSRPKKPPSLSMAPIQLLSVCAFPPASSPLADRCRFAVDCTLAFHSPSNNVSSPVPFQLVLSSPPSSRSSGFAFSRLAIHFNDDRPPIVVEHAEDGERERVNLGDLSEVEMERQADLRWTDGGKKVFTGVVALERELDLTVRHSLPFPFHSFAHLSSNRSRKSFLPPILDLGRYT